MEIQFQQQPKTAVPMNKTTKFKGRSRGNGNNKYVGVRQRTSGRWVAEIKDTTQKIRMWLGTFETAAEAARAYDEAACLLRGSNTRTNFVTHVSPDSPLASRIQNLLNNRKNCDKKIDKKQHSKTPIPSNSSCVTSSRSSSSSPTHRGNTSNTSSHTHCGNSSNSSSPTQSVDSVSPSCQKLIEDSSNLFDDAYKPDMSNFPDEFDLGRCSQSSSTSSWGFGFTEDQMLEMSKNDGLGERAVGGEWEEFSEFERMKVERQISASLYAMNGVHEYMETVFDPIEALWDLPPLCSSLLS